MGSFWKTLEKKKLTNEVVFHLRLHLGCVGGRN